MQSETVDDSIVEKIDVFRDKHTASRKSMRSIGVNERDASKKQIINLAEEELFHLPNRSYYNGDGTKINLTGKFQNMPYRGSKRYRQKNNFNGFSPLI